MCVVGFNKRKEKERRKKERSRKTCHSYHPQGNASMTNNTNLDLCVCVCVSMDDDDDGLERMNASQRCLGENALHFFFLLTNYFPPTPLSHICIFVVGFLSIPSARYSFYLAPIATSKEFGYFDCLASPRPCGLRATSLHELHSHSLCCKLFLYIVTCASCICHDSVEP